MKKIKSYQPKFIEGFDVPLPGIKNALSVPVTLEYQHYTVVFNKKRKLAYYSATNIDGNTIPKSGIDRKGDFLTEKRILENEQAGNELYDVYGSILDKGHLTKYEDVLWGTTNPKTLSSLGKGTFWFPNSAPQHKTLNRGMWSSLEKYILDQESDDLNLRICLFTGPLLLANDPFLKKDICNVPFQIPTLFWKVVVFARDTKLYGVAFLMSHYSLLKKENILIHKRPLSKALEVSFEKTLPFLDYTHSNPYQVQVELIEELTGIQFSDLNLVLPYQLNKPRKLLFKEVEVVRSSSKKSLTAKGQDGEIVVEDGAPRSQYHFPNIQLF